MYVTRSDRTAVHADQVLSNSQAHGFPQPIRFFLLPSTIIIMVNRPGLPYPDTEPRDSLEDRT